MKSDTNQYAILIADMCVPEYRSENARYSCNGQVAKRWQAAYEAAAIVIDDGVRKAASDFIEAWDWWRVDEYDRECPSDEVYDLRQVLTKLASGGEA